MKGVSITTYLLFEWNWSLFLNHRPYPTYSLDDMPKTGFSCREKILGGYYADSETQCQMFHICVRVAGVGIQDFRFLCPNGTAFDQDHQICADWEDVDCDATTLYYSSDNFDLYRIGSGLESKAIKYGEDEETFVLQRAETGDSRLSRQHQVQSVNQQKPTSTTTTTNSNKRNEPNGDIFKGSSSSNFFNNRNKGKDEDDYADDEDTINTNQNRDDVQKRKLNRNNNRRRPSQSTTTNRNDDVTKSTSRSYINSNDEKYSAALNNYRQRNGGRIPSIHQTKSTQYVISTPAPFKFNTKPLETTVTPSVSRKTENYPPNFPKITPKPTTYQQPEEYASTTIAHPSSKFSPKSFKYTQSTPAQFTDVKVPKYEKKFTPAQSSIGFTDVPKGKSTKLNPNTFILPSTFSPKSHAAYSQITHQRTQYNNNRQSTTSSPSHFSLSSVKYTPTVPKVSAITTSTTATTNHQQRSNRFDETQYDESTSQQTRDDESLRVAHSQNIANSRNELINNKSSRYEAPRPFSISSKTTPHPVVVTIASTPNFNTNKNINTNNNSKVVPKPKDVSYDYAYYDTNGSEPDYEIDTEFKKSTIKQ